MARSSMNEVIDVLMQGEDKVVDEIYDSVVVFEKIHPDVSKPSQKSGMAAGYDIEAYEVCVIEPMSVSVIPTGLKIVLPSGMYARIGNKILFLLQGRKF